MLSHRWKKVAAGAALVAIGLIASLAPRVAVAQAAASGSTQKPTGGRIDEPPGGGCTDCGKCVTLWAKGPKKCNCTDDSMVAVMCHGRTVQVTIGSTYIGGISTGQSSSDCTHQQVGPGECVWTEYKIECCDTWLGWSCKSTGDTAQKKGPAGALDCS